VWFVVVCDDLKICDSFCVVYEGLCKILMVYGGSRVILRWFMFVHAVQWS
jgi:hypothetical protein